MSKRCEHYFEALIVLLMIVANIMNYSALKNPYWSISSDQGKVVEIEKTYKGLWATCIFQGRGSSVFSDKIGNNNGLIIKRQYK